MAHPTVGIGRIPVDPSVDSPAQNFIYELLQRAEGPTVLARSNMSVDGSITPVSFFYEVGPGVRLQHARFNIVILDSGIDKPQAFGDIAGPLDPGIRLCILDTSGNVKKDFTGGLNIRQNADWRLVVGVDQALTKAPGPDELALRFTVGKAGDQMLIYAGERIECLVQNDLTGLDEFRIQIQGILEPRKSDDPIPGVP